MDEAAARAAAEEVASALCRRDIAAVGRRLHPRFAAAYPAERLSADVERELDAAGTFEGDAFASGLSVGDYTRVRVECSFDRAAVAVQMAFDDAGSIVELFVRARKLGRSVARAAMVAVLLLAIPAGFAVMLVVMADADLLLGPAFIGTIGWGLGAAFRIPIAMAVRPRADVAELRARWRPSPHHLAAGLSGAAQELARLAALATAGRTFDSAVSIGIGWALVEAMFIAAGLIGAARAHIDAENAVDTLVARAGMSALHIGATVLIARAPLLLLATAVSHFGVMLVRDARLRAGTAASIGAAALVGGLAAFSRV